MPQRVFVKVVGLSAAERHALNTVFRLSEEREIMYSLWVWGAPEAPRLLLVDGDSTEAAAELQAGVPASAKLVWIGAEPPPGAWQVLQRPIAWPDVIHAMDDFFATKGLEFDLDLGHGTDAMDTQPPEPVPPSRRALIVSADRDQRLYLRARLALAGLVMVDEADSGAQALALVSQQPYILAVLKHHLPQVDAWAVLKRLRAAGPDRPAVIVAKHGGTVVDRLRARFGGASAFLHTPVDPVTLHHVLRKVVSVPDLLPPVVLPMHEPSA